MDPGGDEAWQGQPLEAGGVLAVRGVVRSAVTGRRKKSRKHNATVTCISGFCRLVTSGDDDDDENDDVIVEEEEEEEEKEEEEKEEEEEARQRKRTGKRRNDHLICACIPFREPWLGLTR